MLYYNQDRLRLCKSYHTQSGHYLCYLWSHSGLYDLLAASMLIRHCDGSSKTYLSISTVLLFSPMYRFMPALIFSAHNRHICSTRTRTGWGCVCSHTLVITLVIYAHTETYTDLLAASVWMRHYDGKRLMTDTR